MRLRIVQERKNAITAASSGWADTNARRAPLSLATAESQDSASNAPATLSKLRNEPPTSGTMFRNANSA